MGKVRDLVSNNRSEILKLAHQYQMGEVRVFGSVARRTDDDQSDLDLLVSPTAPVSLLAMGGFLMDVRELLGVQVDVMSVSTLKPRIRDQVLAEAVNL